MAVTGSGLRRLELLTPCHDLLVTDVEPVAEREEDKQGADCDQGRPEAEVAEVAHHHDRHDGLVGVGNGTCRRLTRQGGLVYDRLELHNRVLDRVGDPGPAGDSEAHTAPSAGG